MGNIELLLIGIGLAMDAFAVAVCKGLSMKEVNIYKSIVIALWFGIFQFIMPTIGYFLGNTFENLMNTVSHLIAFILLAFIGLKMLKEGFKGEKTKFDGSIEFRAMLILAVATSIDALTVGITFSFFDINILYASLSIGIITFIFAYIGVTIGNKFGNKYEQNAQIVGAIILLGLSIKNLLEHFKVF